MKDGLALPYAILFVIFLGMLIKFLVFFFYVLFHFQIVFQTTARLLGKVQLLLSAGITLIVVK